MAESRDAYVRKLKTKLDEWNAEIDRLAARAQQSGTDARKELNHQLERMREQGERARQTLGQLRDASGEAREKLRSRAEHAWHEFQETLDRAKSRFQ